MGVWNSHNLNVKEIQEIEDEACSSKGSSMQEPEDDFTLVQITTHVAAYTSTVLCKNCGSTRQTCKIQAHRHSSCLPVSTVNQKTYL